MGGTNNDQATGVALDAAGNIYLSAAFGNTVDFDPGTGTVNLVSAGLFDIAVAKYNTAGDYVYAFRIGSSSFDQANAIGVDASGNVYVAGYFDGFVDFDPGAGTAILTSSSSLDIFLAKYDASGNYVFAHKIGSTPGESALGLALDGSGSVYISGYFQGIVDFDPGAGIANLESTGSTDIFIAKYTAAGNYVFAKKIGSAGSDYGNSIAADGNHLYVTGYINGMADTDPSTETINIETINGIDSYIAKYIICSSPALSAQSISANPATVSGATSLTDGGCRLLAVVEPNGASPVSGTVNAQLWIESSVPTFAGQPFVARHYEITPVTNPSTATGRITLYFTQQEFTDFNTHPASTLDLPTGAGDAAGISNLRIGKYNGTSNNGTGLPASYTNGASIIDPADGDIVWNGTLNRWEVSFDVTGFSGFIVQTVSSTLPVNLTLFAARKNGPQSLLSWSTASEQNNKGFYVQRSANGQSFTNLGFVAAKGNGSGASYSFTDAAPLSGRNFYRLVQVDEDGKSSFSPVRELSFGLQALRIYPNPVQQTLTLTGNTGNEPLCFRLTDLSGRVLKTWSFSKTPGTLQLNLNGIPAGNYLLETKQGVQETKTVPVMKQ
ncbi:MAG: T9SS type A sorting domain-containing protein [Lacibacter sp.]